MKLSIIVVNYKSWQHLDNALQALESGFPADWEIIVVDNESEPQALERFASNWSWPKLVPNPQNSGFGFGSAIGVSHSSGERLLFMNPDVVASCADIRALLAEQDAHPDAAIIVPRQIGTNGHAQKVFDEFPGFLNQSKSVKAIVRLFMQGSKPDPRKHYKELVYPDWVTGSCLLIDRVDYAAIGGWSSDYWMYGEDADLCKRANNLGLRCAYTPNVEIVHTHGGSSRINVAIKALTKVEVIISKHVYASNHAKGVMKPLTHLLIVFLKVPPLIVATFADLITLRRIPTLRVRRRMLTGLTSYYRGVVVNGSWLSPRALANKLPQL